MANPEKRTRLYDDTIHGNIHLPRYLFIWIDKPEFQRLRRIKQLGLATYVFEGATHTRFGHSIGVAHLAHIMITGISENHQKVDSNIIKCITTAGLLHDIGHGPFSHLFERCIQKIIPDFSHEEMSTRIIDHMWSKHQDIRDQYTKEDVTFIQSLIKGEVPANYPFPFHYEIVANPVTSIDVDKFDYLQRDAKYAKSPISFDPSRLLTNFRIIDGHLTYYQKELYNIYELFHTRYMLFKTIYTHKTKKAIDEMVYDLFASIDLREYYNDINKYISLTDHFIYTIDSFLIYRLETRKLYKVLWEGVFDLNPNVTTEMVIKKFPELQGKIVLRVSKINMSKGTNPLENIPFCHSKKDPTVCASMKQPIIYPVIYEEFSVLLIGKEYIPEETIKAFSEWIKSEKMNNQELDYKNTA